MRATNLDKIREELKRKGGKGNRVALLHGCFDDLHEGHLNLFRRAREIAGIVLVGLEGDEYVRHKKGNHRPHFIEKDRVEVLRKSGLVDYLFIIPASNNVEIYRQLYTDLKPDFLVTAKDEVLDKKELDANAAGIKLIVIEKSHHSSRNHPVAK